MSKDALVIGGAGFLGSGIVRELQAAGWTVTVIGRGNKQLADHGIAFVRVDRTEAGALAAAVGDQTYDLVVDCAAYKAADTEGAVQTFAGKIGHFVFISTDFVYAPDYEGPFPIREDAPKERERPYGTGKLACEAILARAWEAQRFPATTLRPPHIMGAGRELGTGTVQGRDPKMLVTMRAGDTAGVTLLAEGQLVIQPVWNREVGTCIAHVAGNPQAFGQTFNCTGPDCVTTRLYYQLVADRLGVPLRTTSLDVSAYLERWPDRAPFARHRIYDLRHLTETTGYTPRWPLADAIAETVGWMDAQSTTP